MKYFTKLSETIIPSREEFLDAYKNNIKELGTIKAKNLLAGAATGAISLGALYGLLGGVNLKNIKNVPGIDPRVWKSAAKSILKDVGIGAGLGAAGGTGGVVLGKTLMRPALKKLDPELYTNLIYNHYESLPKEEKDEYAKEILKDMKILGKKGLFK